MNKLKIFKLNNNIEAYSYFSYYDTYINFLKIKCYYRYYYNSQVFIDNHKIIYKFYYNSLESMKYVLNKIYLQSKTNYFIKISKNQLIYI